MTAEIQVLQNEIEAIKERLEKYDEDRKRIWERIDKHAQDMIRIQVLMENVEKTMGEVKVTLAAMGVGQNKADNKWTSFFEKWFWLAAGAAMTYLSTLHH